MSERSAADRARAAGWHVVPGQPAATSPEPTSVWVVSIGDFYAGSYEPLFAVHSEAEAEAANEAGHGNHHHEVPLLAPGETPRMVTAYSAYLASGTGEPVLHAERVYEWQAPGPCEDGTLPGGDGQGIYGTDRALVAAALNAWAERSSR